MGVLTVEGGPAKQVPVGWAIEGGNCLYSFTNTQGIAAISLSVPPSTGPGLYKVIANIATVDWDVSPFGLVQVEFVYQVIAALNLATSPDRAGVGTRIEGRPIQIGGR